MEVITISFYAILAGALGGSCSHISWLLKITDNGAISNKKDVRSIVALRLKVLALNLALGACVGWTVVLLYNSHYGLNQDAVIATSQIVAIGFLSSLFRQDLVELAKRKI